MVAANERYGYWRFAFLSGAQALIPFCTESGKLCEIIFE